MKKVKSTNDKGLIGITEEGEEVPLSAPKPNTILKFYKVGFSKINNKRI